MSELEQFSVKLRKCYPVLVETMERERRHRVRMAWFVGVFFVAGVVLEVLALAG